VGGCFLSYQAPEAEGGTGHGGTKETGKTQVFLRIIITRRNYVENLISFI
jgi:hypothetical protein